MGRVMRDVDMAAWSIKGWYDYVHLVAVIRYLEDDLPSRKIGYQIGHESFEKLEKTSCAPYDTIWL
ncbi:hypothetical protein N6H18_16715 [Reichenbachiella agarivorans]|uniref:Transposase n=1 Tax=Reichenbachiella agarivorans TaxID=2979464 RepID=A0ABY6CRA2_9BACT|nr:hypothetical protein [Reichenbachiella agarivorans]UXP31988.1 hypothetical protein N6H18_16715 [Reichenbachiella agarivorans]